MVLCNILLRWQRGLLDDPGEVCGEIAGQKYYLTMGALALAKELAQKMRNSELLLLAGGIELLIAEREAQHDADEKRAMAAEWRVSEFRDQVRKACVQYFFKASEFKPDLSKYWSAVEAARSSGTDPGVIEGLEKYLNEQNIIQRVYREVRDSLSSRLVEEGMVRLQTCDEMEVESKRAMEEFYRSADRTVFDRLRNHGISPHIAGHASVVEPTDGCAST